jgi:dipeptidyl aminopeptidase/acylaminoacyl peptidase
MPETKPFGSWSSRITSDLIASASVRLDQVVLGDDAVYWIEGRPNEGGRSVIVKRSMNGETVEVNPAPFNARSKVHEYGGGSYWVNGDTVYFCHFTDGQIYSVNPGGKPVVVTSNPLCRYADGVVDARQKRLICVRETHSEPSVEATNEIVSIDLSNGAEVVLASGFDFFAYPRLSADGMRLAWVCWNHPNMPWDGSELWQADVTSGGGVANPRFIAGGLEESITQPEWSTDGQLYFVSDKSGWWNIWRCVAEGVEPVLETDAEFGRPLWVFGMSSYGFSSSEEIICAYTRHGSWTMGRLNVRTRELKVIETPFTDISYLRVNPSYAGFLAGSATQFTSVVLMDVLTGEIRTVKSSNDVVIDPQYFSVPKAIEFPTTGNLVAHGYYYPPRNPQYQAPEGELPPLLVKSHGGPTSATSDTLSLSTQFWTSRGFAVLDVNYGGSTGYGRAYRERLNGQWGVVDVDDCANGALFLADSGLADRNRLAISGGSAGGYTTLCALTFKNVFKAGASYYGISDLEALAQDTHKFESRYEDRLVGPYPDSKELYKQRSPINYVDKLSCPAIFFQGLEDKVVPPNQAEMMVEALKKKKLPVAYVTFEGEQHGFRKADSIKRALESELYFYSRIFKFDPADKLPAVEIMNAP